MDLDRLKRMKKMGKLTAQDISVEADIPLSTVQKIFAGQVKNPREKTLKAIERVLDKYADNRAYAEKIGREYIDYELDSMYREYTVEDYYAIPDDMRVELIDGRIYNLAAPSLTHQHIVGSIYYSFRNFIDQNDKDCRMYMAPVDVRLDLDDKTMIQPDLVAFCDHNEKEGEEDGDESGNKKNVDPRLANDKNVEGAPDFVAEVISRWSLQRDAYIKYGKYQNAGVREYWLIDPFRKTVTVNDFANDTQVIYTFSDKVPVALTNGELVIDFSKMTD